MLERIDDGFFAIDREWQFTFLNERAADLLDVDREAAVGEAVWDEFPEAVGTAFQRNYERAMETQEPVSFEEYFPPLERWFEVTAYPSQSGLSVHFQDVTERVEREAELRNRVDQQEIVANLGRRALEERDLDPLLSDAARFVAEALGMDYCRVLALDGDELILRQGVGWRDGVVGSATVSAVENDSQAAYTLSVSEPVVVENLETETRFSGPDLLRNHDVTSGISAVIGPIDDPWGVLGTHSRDQRTFTEREVNFVQSVANTLAAAINRRENEREIRSRHERLVALNEINSLVHSLAESLFGLDSKSEIEALVCERLTATDSYEFAWIGTLEDREVETSTEAGVEDYLSDLRLSPEHPVSRDGPTVQAHETGEMQVVRDAQDDPRYEPWRDRAHEYGYRASAAVPIGTDDGEYGSLNVYSDRSDAFKQRERRALRRLSSIVAYALRAVERDRKLQHERDRLEFMNRLLRHNMLNSLNVISARLDMLEGRVDFEVSDHLETAAARTNEMIEFVGTVRDVTKVIGRTDEQELRPVALDDALTSRVDRAERLYPETTFHLEDPPSVDIVVDELLEKCLDNVLVNAVQHNDSETPTVRVDTTVDDDEVVVSVADNGPGIPDERKPETLDRDAPNFDDPGSGFGLYLVQEIIDSYGGTIEVKDSAAGGARFELTFERAR